MIKDYLDEHGFKHRVWLADDDDGRHPEQGLPISLDLEPIAAALGWNMDFARALQEELWAQGVITADDFLRDNIHAKVDAAIKHVTKLQAHLLIASVRRSIDNG